MGHIFIISISANFWQSGLGVLARKAVLSDNTWHQRFKPDDQHYETV